MKRLIAHESLAHIGHLRNLLEQGGIECLIKNDQLSGGLGEIPFLDCLPELWVVRDEDLPQARSILAENERPDARGKDWRCGQCKELNEGQFAVCWKCGAPDSSKD